MNNRVRTFIGYLIVGTALTLGACAKSDNGGGGGGGGGGQIAQTPPPPCNGPQGVSCNPGFYGQDPSLIIPQAYVNGMNNGYCGCQLGYRPIYNPQWGFACAPANTFGYQNYVGYNYNSIYQGQNYGQLTTQQIYYTPLQYGGTTGSCFSDFALSCDVRVANSCSNGGQCRPVGGGSAIGVCTQGYGVDQYNSGYYGNYNGYGYGGYGYGGYNGYSNGSNNCKYRTTSYGLSYYYCGF
jgi:hypothetical protein